MVPVGGLAASPKTAHVARPQSVMNTSFAAPAVHHLGVQPQIEIMLASGLDEWSEHLDELVHSVERQPRCSGQRVGVSSGPTGPAAVAPARPYRKLEATLLGRRRPGP